MKFTVLYKRKSRRIKISTLMILHKELIFQKNYDKSVLRNVFNAAQII